MSEKSPFPSLQQPVAQPICPACQKDMPLVEVMSKDVTETKRDALIFKCNCGFIEERALGF
jgi:hypothetical protein